MIDRGVGDQDGDTVCAKPQCLRDINGASA
jgi:hypothetical protein